ncbi:hypothetical protein ACWCQW_19550 [Streptomyces mirabilis]
MFGDAQAADVVALPGVLTAAGGEVQFAEEQRAFGEFAQIPGLAAQLPAEHFGVGTGGGDVLAGDDLLLGAVDHRGEAGPAGVVVGAFMGEGAGEGGVG